MDYDTLRTYIGKGLRLSDEDVSLLIGHTRSQDLKKGETILKEGEVCRAIYLVEKGYLRTYYNKGGTPINLNFTFEGAFASNMKSIQSKQGSEFIIEAGEDTSIRVFDLDLLSAQFKQQPQFSLFIRRLAIQLFLASEEHSNLFKMYTPTERYRYMEKNNPQLLQRISLSQLSSYLGVSRETLSRIRGKKS